MSAKNMLKEIRVEDAVGMVLAHDLTQIVPGSFKGRLFRKGHVIREQDIPKLLDIGKEHIYIVDLEQGYVHEDDAARRMAEAVCGEHTECTEPKEGKVSVVADVPGLAKVDKTFIDEVNALGEIAMSTVVSDRPLAAGEALLATRVIPLIVAENKIVKVEQMARRHKEERGHPPIRIKPFRKLRVGLVTTGGEVYSGRIEDKFGPVVRQKVERFGSDIIEQKLAPDDMDAIVGHILHFKERQADLILVTGGMSVDPDDRTPGAIRKAGAQVVSYGTPMLPGSMLMIAYLDETPVLGLPGCVMHDPYTSFDVFLPRICAGEKIEKKDVVSLGYGGLHSC